MFASGYLKIWQVCLKAYLVGFDTKDFYKELHGYMFQIDDGLGYTSHDGWTIAKQILALVHIRS